MDTIIFNGQTSALMVLVYLAAMAVIPAAILHYASKVPTIARRMVYRTIYMACRVVLYARYKVAQWSIRLPVRYPRQYHFMRAYVALARRDYYRARWAIARRTIPTMATIPIVWSISDRIVVEYEIRRDFVAEYGLSVWVTTIPRSIYSTLTALHRNDAGNLDIYRVKVLVSWVVDTAARAAAIAQDLTVKTGMVLQSYKNDVGIIVPILCDSPALQNLDNTIRSLSDVSEVRTLGIVPIDKLPTTGNKKKNPISVYLANMASYWDRLTVHRGELKWSPVNCGWTGDLELTAVRRAWQGYDKQLQNGLGKLQKCGIDPSTDNNNVRWLVRWNGSVPATFAAAMVSQSAEYCLVTRNTRGHGRGSVQGLSIARSEAFWGGATTCKKAKEEGSPHSWHGASFHGETTVHNECACTQIVPLWNADCPTCGEPRDGKHSCCGQSMIKKLVTVPGNLRRRLTGVAISPGMKAKDERIGVYCELWGGLYADILAPFIRESAERECLHRSIPFVWKATTKGINS